MSRPFDVLAPTLHKASPDEAELAITLLYEWKRGSGIAQVPCIPVRRSPSLLREWVRRQHGRHHSCTASKRLRASTSVIKGEQGASQVRHQDRSAARASRYACLSPPSVR